MLCGTHNVFDSISRVSLAALSMGSQALVLPCRRYTAVLCVGPASVRQNSPDLPQILVFLRTP